MNWSLGPMVDTSLFTVCVKMLAVNSNIVTRLILGLFSIRRNYVLYKPQRQSCCISLWPQSNLSTITTLLRVCCR